MPSDDSQVAPAVKKMLPFCNLKYINLLLDTVKKAAILLWAISITLVAIFLWLYLIKIGAQDLFFKSVASLQGLTILLLATVTIAFCVLLLTFISSYFIVLTSFLFKDDKPPKRIWVPFLVLPGVYLVSFLIGALTCVGVAGFWALSILGTVTVVIACFFPPCICKQDSLATQVDISLKEKRGNKFLLILFLIFSGMCVFFSFYTFLKISVLPKEIDILGIILVGLISLLSYFPGVAFLQYKSTGKPISKALGVAGIILVLVVLLILLCLPLNIKEVILGKTGIYSSKPSDYKLLNPELTQIVAEIFPAPEKSKDGAEESKGDGTFTAYTRYHFGGVHLLCNEPFDPDTKNSTSGKDLLLPENCISFDDSDIKVIYRQKQST